MSLTAGGYLHHTPIPQPPIQRLEPQPDFYEQLAAQQAKEPAPKEYGGILGEVQALRKKEKAADLSGYVDLIRQHHEGTARAIDISSGCRKAQKSLDEFEADAANYAEFCRLKETAAGEAEARSKADKLEGEVKDAEAVLAEKAEALRIAQRDHDIAALYARRAEEARESHNDGPLSTIRNAKCKLREAPEFVLFRDSSIDSANAEALRIGAAEGAAQRRTDKIKADLESAEFELSASIAHEESLRHSCGLLKRDRGVDVPIVERKIDDMVQRIASLRKQVPQLRRSYEAAKAEETRLAEEYRNANKAAEQKADELILS